MSEDRPFRIVSWNARCARGKEPMIEDLATRNDLVFVLEARLKERESIGPIQIASAVHPVGRNEAPKYGVLLVGRDHSHVQVIDVDEQGFFITVQIGCLMVIGIYLPPGKTNPECKDIILRAMRNVTLEGRSSLIMIGDYNMRLGAQVGDKQADFRGKMLPNWIEDQGLDRVDFCDPTPTFMTRLENGRYKSSIVDHVYVSSYIREKITECRVLDQQSGSDHFPIRIQCRQSRPKMQVRKIAFHRLNEADKREAYIEMVEPLLYQMDHQLNYNLNFCLNRPVLSKSELQLIIDQTDYHLNQILLGASAQVCGFRSRWRQLKYHRDEMIKKLKKEARMIERSFFRQFKSGKTPDKMLYREVRSIQRQLRERVKELDTKSRNSYYDKLGKTSSSEMLKMLRFSKQKAQSQRKDISKEMIEKVASHFEKSASPIQGVEYLPHEISGPDMGDNVRLASPQIAEEYLSLYFSAAAFNTAIRRCANGKAPGPSGLVIEMIKPVSMAVATVMSTLSRVIVSTGLVPEAWRNAVICPIPKKQSPKEACDYRPISLTQVLRRVFEKAFLPIVEKSMVKVSQEQNGFRRNRSTLDACAILQQTLVEMRTRRKTPSIAFLDIKAAYDTVPRGIVYKKCSDIGMNSTLISILRGLFEGCRSTVRMKAEESRHIEHKLGLLQGSSLSPLLYLVYIDDLVQNLRKEGALCTLGDFKLNCLLFADDIALIAESMRDLQKLCDIAQDHSIKNRYKFGVQKCAYVSTDEEAKLFIAEHEIQRVSSFKYLGVYMDKNGINPLECIEKSEARALQATNELKRAGIDTSRLPIRICIRAFRSFIRPILEYGTPIYPKNPKADRLLERAYIKTLTATLGISPQIKRTKLWTLLDERPAWLRQDLITAKYYQKINSRGSTFLIKKALTASDRGGGKLVSPFTRGKRSLHTRRLREITDVNMEKVAEMLKDEALITIRDKEDLGDFGKMRDVSTHGNEKTRTLVNMIDDLCDSKMRKWVFLWILNRIPFAGKNCCKCRKEKISKNHIVKCTNAENFLGSPPDPLLMRTLMDGNMKKVKEIQRWWLSEVSGRILSDYT